MMGSELQYTWYIFTNLCYSKKTTAYHEKTINALNILDRPFKIDGVRIEIYKGGPEPDIGFKRISSKESIKSRLQTECAPNILDRPFKIDGVRIEIYKGGPEPDIGFKPKATETVGTSLKDTYLDSLTLIVWGAGEVKYTMRR